MKSIDAKTLQRFWSKVEKRSDDECWEWKAGKTPAGYGLFYFEGRRIGAHRFALMTVVGRIDENIFACHRCDNPLCVNPSHLFLGTQSDNMLDMSAKGRHFAHATPERVLRGEDHGMARLTWEQVGTIRSLADQKTQEELSEEYGVSVRVIQLIILNKAWKDANYNPPKRKQIKNIGDRQRAEDNPSAKLTWEDVHRIREMGKTMSCEAIAKIFNIHHENARYIIKNKTWVDPNYNPPIEPPKLTIEVARQVRQLFTSGEYTGNQLAEKFGISKSSVWRILGNKILVE